MLSVNFNYVQIYTFILFSYYKYTLLNKNVCDFM